MFHSHSHQPENESGPFIIFPFPFPGASAGVMVPYIRIRLGNLLKNNIRHGVTDGLQQRWACSDENNATAIFMMFIPSAVRRCTGAGRVGIAAQRVVMSLVAGCGFVRPIMDSISLDCY